MGMGLDESGLQLFEAAVYGRVGDLSRVFRFGGGSAVVRLHTSFPPSARHISRHTPHGPLPFHPIPSHLPPSRFSTLPSRRPFLLRPPHLCSARPTVSLPNPYFHPRSPRPIQIPLICLGHIPPDLTLHHALCFEHQPRLRILKNHPQQPTYP